MINLRRADQRHRVRRGRQEILLTFHPQDRGDPLADGFGALEILNEDNLPPGAVLPLLPHHDAEIVTYVHQGTLTHEDIDGRPGVISAGEFQRMTPGRRVRRSETNASRTEWAHVYQMCLRPSQGGLAASHEQRRFSTAERRGLFCVVASQDGRRGSLHVHQDARIYSAMLDPGQHVVHELSQGRSAWLHVVRGEASLGDVILTTGDGVGLTAVRAVSLTALEATEILLVDLGEPPKRSLDKGAVQ